MNSNTRALDVVDQSIITHSTYKRNFIPMARDSITDPVLGFITYAIKIIRLIAHGSRPFQCKMCGLLRSFKIKSPTPARKFVLYIEALTKFFRCPHNCIIRAYSITVYCYRCHILLYNIKEISSIGPFGHKPLCMV